MDIETQSKIIIELERYLAFIYKEKAGDRQGLPAVTVSIQTRGKKASVCGSFKAEGWHTKEGQPVHEIIVSSEHLFEDPYKILGTMTHEAVHLFNRDCGETDCNKAGRHTEVFKEVALKWGLEVEDPTDSKGFAYTHTSPELQKLLETKFKPNETVFRIFKEQQEVKPKKEVVKKIRPWECQCPVTLQVAVGVELDAKCGVCVSDFKLKK